MSGTELKELNQAKKLIGEGKFKESSHIISELEKRSDISDHDLLLCTLLKGRIFCRFSRYLEAINYTKPIMQEGQKQGYLVSYFDTLMIHAYCYLMGGNLSRGETLLKQAEELFKTLEGPTELEFREKESFMFRTRANLLALRGDTLLSMKLNKKALELAKNSEDKELITASLINISEGYQYLGDYENAISYAKRTLDIQYSPLLMWRIGILIESLLGKKDIEGAKFYFQKMSDLKDKGIYEVDDVTYQYYKALILKTSLRAKDRVLAEETFKYLIEEKEGINFQLLMKALLSICGLLLIELRFTNDANIIDEIEPYIKKLLNYSEKEQSYWFFAETYLLQAKLSLLTFDIKKARRFLIQAQQIAERFEFTQLVKVFSKENENLFKNLDTWEDLKEIDVPMAKRIELAQIDELIEKMTQKRIVVPQIVTEERIAITKEKKICLVCKGEVIKFSYICECGAIYCDICARALTNLENLCWACETSIDPLKPIKTYKNGRERKVLMKQKKGNKIK